MLIQDDLNIYFADLGQDVFFNGITKKGLLDMPDEIISGDLVISTDYILRVQTKEFEDVVVGNTLIIFLNNVKTNFEVRSKRMEDDGATSLIGLSKTWVLKEKLFYQTL